MIQGKSKTQDSTSKKKEDETIKNEPRTFRGMLWDVIMYFMWLPLLIAKSWTMRVIGLVMTLYSFVEPMIKKVWNLICIVSPMLATCAEKVPCVGKYLAWGLNLPPRLDIFFLLEKALSVIKSENNEKKVK